MNVRNLFKCCAGVGESSVKEELDAGRACFVPFLVCVGWSQWAGGTADGRGVAFSTFGAAWGSTLVCCGLIFFHTYHASRLFCASFLMVFVLLALVASGSAVVGPRFLKVGSVVEHACPPIWNGDISEVGDDDCAASAGSEGHGRVHPP